VQIRTGLISVIKNSNQLYNIRFIYYTDSDSNDEFSLGFLMTVSHCTKDYYKIFYELLFLSNRHSVL
jgi:hypothetical protein